MRNDIQFRLWGRYALFTDPVTRMGGEKCSYQIPTYEALKGIAASIYWKPTFNWVIDRVRVINAIRTQTKGVKPLRYSEGGNDLSIYTYLADVEYQVQAHFEWDEQRPELEKDRNEGKHFEVARRMLDRGGRRDIFLGTRECQGYVAPCKFNTGSGAYDNVSELAFGVMFHGFDYPSTTGDGRMYKRLWRPIMCAGVIHFIHPSECSIREPVREMRPKAFIPGTNFSGLIEEGLQA